MEWAKPRVLWAAGWSGAISRAPANRPRPQLHFATNQPRDTQLLPGVRVLGVEFHATSKACDCGGDLAPITLNIRQLEPGVGVPWSQANRFCRRTLRLRQAPRLVQRDGEVIVGLGYGWMIADQVAKPGDRLFESLLALQQDTEISSGPPDAPA